MRFLLAVLAAAVAAVLLGVPTAQAVTCPNPVPVVNENNCQGAGSTGWRLTNFDGSRVAGFATSTSVDKDQDVPLKIARSGGGGTVDLAVYRIGYYGGAGGRRVHTATGVSVGGSLSCNATSSTTGHADCNNWSTAYTVPGSALPASGVYVVRIVDTATGKDNQILFTVRDDNRVPESQILFKLPVATYQAYNHFTGKSFYDSLSSGNATITGGPRAVKLSFDRPFDNVYNMQNWFMDADYPLIYWLEQQGYDVSYTDNVAVHENPAELSQHDALVVSGHDEYWSREELNGYKAARDAGVDIASFSANTAYWKVRYEDGGSTIVSYKTVEGAGGNGALGVNDWGPDGLQGTTDDALGLDQLAGTSDDHPENATTTFRDNGASPGDPNAPAGGRVGPDTPENSLLGAMFIGGHETRYLPLMVPGANAQNEFAGDRMWRRTGISSTSGATIPGKQVSWEWDTVPTQAQYVSRQPSGVKRVSETETCCDSNNIYLHDEGRIYQSTPPPGQPSSVNAVKYTAPSGAIVFHAGAIHWSWGLGPHWIDQPFIGTYLDTPVDSSDVRIQQATYNLLSDDGVQPNTPVGIVPDGGNQSPAANFNFSPNPAQTGQTVTFDGSASSDSDGSIGKYEWDLDGNGSFETDTGTNPIASRSYASPQTLSIRLRVTDNQGATGETLNTLTVGSGASGPYSGAVLGTAGLTHYWRLGETTGSTFADSKGTAHATATGGTVFGAPGALVSETNAAAGFDGTDDAASAALNLSATNKLTIEFWLDWSAYADDDDLALEYTPNFNQQDGGFAVIPNAGGTGGRFAVSIGRGTNRNAITFTRPSAGEWHHYAFVIDTAAPADQQITPYVDGSEIAHTQLASGTGAGNFAASTLYFMSRAASSLFGNGSLDELAVYERALDVATIHDHWLQAGTVNAPPTASFSVSPSAPAAGQTVTFDGSASSDSDGSIGKYEWDLDGNGSFETDTGTNPIASRSYATPGSVTVMLRVTDNDGLTVQTSRTLTVQNDPPTASFTATPSTPQTGQTVTFDAAASSDDGSIATYEWDLDGNGSFETDSGTTPSTSKSYTTVGDVSVGLRVTDNSGLSGQTTRTVTITSAYATAVRGTPGLKGYWRLADTDGTARDSSSSNSNGTYLNGPLVFGPLIGGEQNSAHDFDGVDDYVDLSPTALGTPVQVSAEAWVRTDTTKTSNSVHTLILDSNSDTKDGWLLAINASNRAIFRAAGKSSQSTTASATATSAVTLAPGTTHHVVGTYDGSTLRTYVDGTLSGSAPFTVGVSYTGSRDLLLGRKKSSPGGSYLDGKLDEAAIYNVALPAATAQSHWNMGTP